MAIIAPISTVPITPAHHALEFHTLNSEIDGKAIQLKAAEQDSNSDGFLDFQKMYFTGQDGKHTYGLTVQADKEFHRATYTLIEKQSNGDEAFLGEYTQDKETGDIVAADRDGQKQSLFASTLMYDNDDEFNSFHTGIKLADGTFVELPSGKALYGIDIYKTQDN